ncbi:uncharacterized protein LOC134031469 isoform X2 [Osmerus eperlanus]|uniref:uncharacterized protein LOC134031469 isoform X2 n=1 Tax=Osmerus eperlanus TaxID=29151 RepID=UPI002E132A05
MKGFPGCAQESCRLFYCVSANHLTIIIASVSCLVFFIMIILLLAILYRKDPLCCRFYRGSQHHTDVPPHYHSRQSLVGCSYNQQGAGTTPGEMDPQLGRLFIVGKPSSYHLQGPPPRLPSYESVRKKDRQRLIHSMIADRFGLNGPYSDSEPPPTYEETLRRSVEISAVDLQSPETPSSSSLTCPGPSPAVWAEAPVCGPPGLEPRGPAADQQ